MNRANAAQLSIDRCDIRGNTCVHPTAARGGGIWVGGSAIPGGSDPLVKIHNSFIVGNGAETTGTGSGHVAHGGGIYSLIQGDTVNIETEICNSTIADNKATCPLGGMYLAEARGGGMYAEQHIAELNNAIFWGNEAYEWDGLAEVPIAHEIAIAGTSGFPAELVVGYSDVEEGEIDATCADVASGILLVGSYATKTCGSGNIETDPDFLFAAGGNYHIDDTSPCYNLGDIAGGCGDYDIDFEDRLYFRVDMGADEWWP